jgi:mannitol/fructose-specific phosphotransferase system IIA component (Ntr-type)
MDMLAEIAQLLSHEPSRQRIAAAHTPEDVLQTIRDYAHSQDL